MKRYVIDSVHLMEPLGGLCERPDWERSVYLKSEADKEVEQKDKEIERLREFLDKIEVWTKTTEHNCDIALDHIRRELKALKEK